MYRFPSVGPRRVNFSLATEGLDPNVSVEEPVSVPGILPGDSGFYVSSSAQLVGFAFDGIRCENADVMLVRITTPDAGDPPGPVTGNFAALIFRPTGDVTTV